MSLGIDESLPQVRHYGLLKEGLEELWNTKIMSDISLEASGQTFSAHKCVLVACSPYFKAMYSGSFQESRRKVVKLEDVGSAALEILLSFMYTGSLPLCDDNVEGILRAAHLLQVHVVTECCIDYLVRDMAPEKCLAYMKIGEELQLSRLEDKAQICFHRNFPAVARSTLFLEISKDALISVLSSDDTIGSEIELFQGAERWLLHQLDRLDVTMDLMRHIRFGLLSPEDGARHIMSSELMINREFRAFSSEAFTILCTKTQYPFPDKEMCRPRNSENCVVIIGGSVSSGPVVSATQRVMALNKDGARTDLEDMPDPVTRSVAVVIDSFIYLFGGAESDLNPSAQYSDVVRYHISTNSWQAMAPMLLGRHSATGCKVGDHVIIAGGIVSEVDGGYQPTQFGCSSSVERYSIKEDTWEYIRELSVAKESAACCEHKGDMYLCGGQVGNALSREMYKYSGQVDVWERKAAMHYARKQHAIHSSGEKLVVAGGYHGYNNEPPIEVYDPCTNQWTEVGYYFGVTLKHCQMTKWDRDLVFVGTKKKGKIVKALIRLNQSGCVVRVTCTQSLTDDVYPSVVALATLPKAVFPD